MILPSIVIFMEIIVRSTINITLLFALNALMLGQRLSKKEMLMLHQTVALSYAVTIPVKSNLLVYMFVYVICYCVVRLWHSINIGRQKNG